MFNTLFAFPWKELIKYNLLKFNCYIKYANKKEIVQMEVLFLNMSLFKKLSRNNNG